MSLYFSASDTLYVFSTLAVTIFLLGFLGKIFLWTQGKAPSFHKKAHVKNIIRIFFRNVIFQKQIFRQSRVRWIMHMLIFGGFMGLLIHTTFLFFCSHFLSPESTFVLFFYKGNGKLILDFWGDLFGLFMILGVVIAFSRRIILKSEQLDTMYSDILDLLFLFVIGITGFFCEGVRISQGELTPEMRFSFIGYPLAILLEGLHLDGLNYGSLVWIHLLVSLIFIAYIPFSKMIHIFTTPTEILINASEEALRKDIYG
jgi:nitrate reductase gamma subunit